MIAPQPFFEPRGAPFCVYQHIRALIESGYEIDLVTYPIGTSVNLPHLHIYRTPALPCIHEVKPGPSLAKIPLDMLIFFTVLWRLCVGRYRYVCAHEEGALLAIPLVALFRCKLLYYMHCNLAELISENRLIYRCAEAVQKFMLRRASAVVVFYPRLTQLAQDLAPYTRVYEVLPPAVDEGLPPAHARDVAHLRWQLRLGDGPVLLYTGTLEQYQGVDILLRSIPMVCAEYPNARYVIVGGKPHQIKQLRLLARRLRVAQYVQFVGQRPLEEMPLYMALATVLMSPRCKANHVPLKLYTYLRSGKPILATNILSHTQILRPEIAFLVPPTSEWLGLGTLELLREPDYALELGRKGQRYAEEHYGWSTFVEKCRAVYREFAPSRSIDEI
jgi:glycosyltransferase involved in cell wall biosynthesis